MLTDGRFSGGSHGYVVGHVCPEAQVLSTFVATAIYPCSISFSYNFFNFIQEGGPIGLVENGDMITIDILKRRIDVDLTSEELAQRKSKWKVPPYKASRGVLFKVSSNLSEVIS